MSDDKYLFQDEDDEIMFQDEDDTQETVEPADESSWKVLIVDDDADVHRMTKFVLSHVSYASHPIEFVSCYSGEEAKEYIKGNKDVSVILLDVVMETDDAGLKVVKYIREELENNVVRIILRTGQPGQAPEQEVIVNYDINDYKSKTELTSDQLFTSLISALRSYKDLVTIEKNRISLERIIKASSNIFELQSEKKFVSGILKQFVTILGMDEETDKLKASGFSAFKQDGSLKIVGVTGKYGEDLINKEIHEAIDPKDISLVDQALVEKRSLYSGKVYVGYYKFTEDIIYIVYIKKEAPIEEWEHHIIEVFNTNIAVASANVYLNQELENLVRERTTELEIANSKLKALSLSDPLTALFNRRYIYEHVSNISTNFIKNKIKTFQGYERRNINIKELIFGVYILDIDHFKLINDTYGHESGDIVLKQLADYLKKSTRADDFVVRWGGEEFLIILQNTNREFLDKFAEKILTDIKSLPMELEKSDTTIHITCSVGYTKLPFIEPKPDSFNLHDIINIADYGLYTAKKNGRDRACRIDPRIMDSLTDDAKNYISKLSISSPLKEDYISLKETFSK